MHICFIVEGYPTKEDPFMPFVRELIAEEARKGVKCSVIAPQSITRALKHGLPIRKRKWRDMITEDKYIEVYQPYYFTISNYSGTKSIEVAVRNAFRKIKQPIDALYAHFWHMGVIASTIKTKKPIFIACGESKISVCDRFSEKKINNLIERLCGVIYVSTKSYLEARQLGLQKNNPYVIAPNGYKSSLFFPKEKEKCRRQMGWSKEQFIVSFVGAFNTRKGSQRLSNALNVINASGREVYSIFIGDGIDEPKCNNILFQGKLEHDAICDYLCASDLFVLPTTNEGCCNAIIEALACGLPVISSNAEFNDDILDESCSIRINPMDSEQIATAIERIYDNPDIQNFMSKGAIERASELRIEVRAEKIKIFIENQVRNYKYETETRSK